jgi:hypothetical protein
MGAKYAPISAQDDSSVMQRTLETGHSDKNKDVAKVGHPALFGWLKFAAREVAHFRNIHLLQRFLTHSDSKGLAVTGLYHRSRLSGS